MWIYILAILGIFLSFSFINGYANPFSITTLILIGGMIKLLMANKKLETQHLLHENRIKVLEETLQQSVLQPLQDTPSVAASAAVIVENAKTAIVPEHEITESIETVIPVKKAIKQHKTSKTPTASNPINEALTHVKTYFTTGNPLVKIGGIILFFGLSFLIKFAVSNDMVSVEFGLLSVLVFAILLIGIGFKYRARQGSFGLILQGIGIAVFYLAIFSAAKFFTVFPFGVALGIMVVTVILATFLALIQDAFYLAVFATAGGFLTPILTATGEGSHVVLFGYYTFLNLSIVAIAWYKAWRVLNLIGFAFTFIIATAWGVTRYQPEHFASTEPFLILFFLLYVVVAILFAHRTPFKLKAYVDSALVFGVPTVAFGLQASLVEAFEYYLAYSALGVGALYISLAWWLKDKPKFSLLAESFLALGTIFLSLVIAFALSPEISAVIYALESSAIIWISLRQNRLYARLFAFALELYAVGSFVNQIRDTYPLRLFLNEVYLGFFILSAATLLSAYVYEKYREKITSYEQPFHIILLALGLLLWIGGGFHELQFSPYAYFSIYGSLSALLFLFVSLRYQWQTMQRALELFVPLVLLGLFASLLDVSHPFVKFNIIAIPLLISVIYLLLARLELYFSRFWHVLGLWISTLLLSWELFYHLDNYAFTLALSGVPLLAIAAIYTILKHPRFWPLNKYHELYSSLGIKGLAVGLMLWEVAALNHSGTLLALPYIPLLNPLDLMQVSVAITLLLWLQNQKLARTLLLRMMAGAGMLFVTLFWARLVHAYGSVTYTPSALLENGLFQTGISILYTLIALAIIIYSKRTQKRATWIAGASLLGFVVLKLLVSDMARTGSLERIISFMVVGVLIVAIGFIAPLPPKKEVDA